MNVKSIFINSSVTSLLVILDRLVMYFIPLYYWGVETTALWVTVRSILFLLASVEGGVGQSFSKNINKLKALKSYEENINRIFSETVNRQVRWWLIICSITIVVYLFLIGYFNYEIVRGSVLFSLLLYAGVYYLNQIFIYYLIGVGLIAKAYKINNIVRLLEITALIIVPVIGLEISACLAVMIIIRVLLATILIIRLRKYFVVSLGGILSKARLSGSFGYFLFPVTPAIYNFVPILIFNYLANPSALLNFMISRLFGRVNIQIGQIFHRAIWPVLNRKTSNPSYFNYARLIYFSLSVSIFFLISIVLLVFEDVQFMGIVLDAELIIVILATSVLYGAADVYISSLMSKEHHKYPLVLRNALYVLPIIYVASANVSVNALSLSQYYLVCELIFFLIVYKYDSNKPI